MHELSIVASVVDSVTETLEAYPRARVLEVRLRVGALASVVVESLEFCWGIATEGTPLEGSRLVVKTVPVVMHCAVCDADVELDSLQSFRCPRCGEPCNELRQGRELDIDSIEIDEAAATEAPRPEETGVAE
jgi:hydrogenase nickel incorporation protein HypA/HybF